MSSTSSSKAAGHHCLAGIPQSSHLDACQGTGLERPTSCDDRKVTCKQRALNAHLDLDLVKSADQYDRNLQSSYKVTSTKRTKCDKRSTVSPRATHEASAAKPVTSTPHQEQRHDVDCEDRGVSRPRRQIYNLIGQPVSEEAWKGARDKGTFDAHSWNVLGQNTVRIPGTVEKPEPLDLISVQRRHHDVKDMNVIGQKLGQMECIWAEHVGIDKRMYNVIGQPVISMKQKQQEHDKVPPPECHAHVSAV